MKSILLAFVLAFTLCGCQGDSVVFEPKIDAEFAPYIDDFRRYYVGIWPPNLSIIYVRDISAAADCLGGSDIYSKKVIRIKQTAWLVMQNEQKRASIFHELGHCVLNRRHKTDGLSYMFPNIRTEQFYLENKDALINELF